MSFDESHFRPAKLVLADGTIYNGSTFGAENCPSGGGCVQYEHDRLSGNMYRPLVRGSACRDDLHPDRERRCEFGR